MKDLQRLSLKKILTWLFFTLPTSYKLQVALLCTLELVLSVLSVVFVVYFRNIIDAAVSKNSHVFWFSALMLLMIILTQLILQSLQRYQEEATKANIENYLKTYLLTTLLQREFQAISQIHTGEWLSRLTSDTGIISRGVATIVPGLVGIFSKLFAVLLMVGYIDSKFLWLIFLMGLLYIMIGLGLKLKLRYLYHNIQEKVSQLQVFYQDYLSSLLVINAFSLQQKVTKQAQQYLDEHKRARLEQATFSNINITGLNAVLELAYLSVAVYCAYGIYIGTMSYGTFIAITRLVTQVSYPFANATVYIPSFYSMLVSCERLMEVEDLKVLKTELKTHSEITNFYRKLDAIVFEQASFSYTDRKLLENIQFEIQKGDYIAFLGPSGCGKSTLTKLLLSIYELQKGELFLRLTNGEKVALDSSFHRLFAYVPQVKLLMVGTIRQVITFSDSLTAEEESRLWQALDLVCARELVEQLPQGLDFVLGEDGSGLSEGQLQRLSIARAIYSQSPILVLDESTSALDEETEKAILENMKALTDKTIIIVTHRPAALEICNKQLHFSDSEITLHTKHS
ncbi:ABC transporter ATP-binding protein [Streptococcus merionis]|uniref:ABC transporter ATP-binding protein n=1 Tax=Streptococcus merionis TaxID=400065 RepID=UPI003514FC63